jgi:hypothetical protein
MAGIALRSGVFKVPVGEMRAWGWIARTSFSRHSRKMLRCVIAGSHSLPILASSAVHVTDMRDWQAGVPTQRAAHHSELTISWPDLGFSPLPQAGFFLGATLFTVHLTRVGKKMTQRLEAGAHSSMMKFFELFS